jgi:RNA polymerase sigma-70 factor (ECF subfamily)
MRQSQETLKDRLTDAELLAQVARGDTAALGSLYDRYAPSLARYAACVEKVDAQDVVQKVFLRVMRIAAGFEPQTTTARPWLFAITRHVLQERARSMARKDRFLLRLNEQASQVAHFHGDARHDLARGVANLSHAKRTVLLLYEVEGFSGDEIASMLSIPVNTVWTRLRNARRELRSYYEYSCTQQSRSASSVRRS